MWHHLQEYGTSLKTKEPILAPDMGVIAFGIGTVENVMVGGRMTKVPYLGNSMLDDFIDHLEQLFTGFGVEPVEGMVVRLPALAVFIARSSAKEFGINLNHGYNLKAAAMVRCSTCFAYSPLGSSTGG